MSFNPQSFAGTTSLSGTKENEGVRKIRSSLEHMASALATVDMNALSNSPLLKEPPKPTRQFVAQEFFNPSQDNNVSSSSLLIHDAHYERGFSSEEDDDNSSLDDSYSVVSSLSADESHRFDSNLSAIHADEHDNESLNGHKINCGSPRRPKELRPPRPPVSTFESQQQQGVRNTRPNLVFPSSRPPRNAAPPAGPPRTSSRQVSETPPRMKSRIRGSQSKEAESPLASPIIFRRAVNQPDCGVASVVSNDNMSRGNYSRSQSEYLLRTCPSAGSTASGYSNNNVRAGTPCRQPSLARGKSFESNDSSMISDHVSSIINRGPKAKAAAQHQHFTPHHRRVVSDMSFNTYSSVPDDAIIVNGKVIDGISHRDASISPQNKQLLGSRPRRTPLSGSRAQQHRRIQSSGSWSVRSMMTQESTCLSSDFSAAIDDASSNSMTSSKYHESKKTKSKSKNAIAEEIKWKMGKMMPSLTPVRPLGKRLSSLMKGKDDGDDKVVLERHNGGFLA